MSKTRNILSGILLVSVIGVGVWLTFNWQRAVDQTRVWSFQPSQSIALLASRGGFSSEGVFYFYVAHPEIKSSSDFNDNCRQIEQMNPILGCNISTGGIDSIYILDIDDPELDGIKEVTAAHEMLHVVFSRTSDADRERLGVLLERAYDRVKTDKLEQRMDYYSRVEPGARINELHSIIGTEFSDIGTELEEYYAEYFTDRKEIVGLHGRYNQKFEEIETELADIEAELEQKLPEINSRNEAYKKAIVKLNAEIEAFNNDASSGNFQSVEEFEYFRSRLQSQVRHLNSEKASLQQEITQYNEKVERLNQLGVKLNQLNNSLDSLSQDSI